MAKILFISNISNKISTFCLASLKATKSLGYEYYHAANWSGASKEQIEKEEKEYGITIWNIPIHRSPFSSKNIKAYKKLVALIKKEKIDFIHCNTPVGGLIGRLAGKKCKVKKIIYEAHGFHFYKGAPLINWVLYYPVEKWLARKTDILITINKEDFEFAKKKMRLKKGGRVEYVPGVGIDLSNFANEKTNRLVTRKKLGVSNNDIAVISVGDLITRKNYRCAIEAISKVSNKHIKLFICGDGPDKEKLAALSERLCLSDQVYFLGYRNDIKELMFASDIFLFTSLQEGLARCLMEAMATGLPCVVSNIRGNTDLLEDAGGILCNPRMPEEFASALDSLASNEATRKNMGSKNIEKALSYGIDAIEDKFIEQYSELSRGGYYNLVPAWARKRRELELPLDAKVIISVGELNKNKNNKVIIEALHYLNNSNIHYLCCGIGPEEDSLRKLTSLYSLDDNIHFLGYRTDVNELYECSDIFILSSYREGLSRSLMEAMASDLLCLASKIRGNVDLVDEGNVFEPDDYEKLSRLISNSSQVEFDNRKIDFNNVVEITKNIYKTL